jgi:hypothetical protein
MYNHIHIISHPLTPTSLLDRLHLHHGVFIYKHFLVHLHPYHCLITYIHILACSLTSTSWHSFTTDSLFIYIHVIACSFTSTRLFSYIHIPAWSFKATPLLVYLQPQTCSVTSTFLRVYFHWHPCSFLSTSLRVQFHLLLQTFSLSKTFFYWFPRKLRTFVSFHYKLSMSWNEQRLDYYIWLLWCSIRVRSTYSVWDKMFASIKKRIVSKTKYTHREILGQMV